MTRHVLLKGIVLLSTFLLFCIGPSLSCLPSRSTVNLPYFLCATTTPGNSDPTQDEWPMFHGQLNHTGEAHTTSTARATPFWTYTTGSFVSSSPVVANGRVYVGSDDEKTYCLNAISGGYIWSYPTGMVLSAPAVADGCVYVGSVDNNLYCLNATAGGLLWNYTTGNNVESSPAVAGGRVYAGDYDKNFYCWNATTGGLLWNHTTGNPITSSPAVVGGRVYVGSSDKKVYCWNATTGKQLWNYTTGSAISSSPAVAGGRMYVGSGDKKVYCLNAITGKQVWNYTTGSSIKSSPAVAYGRLYVGSSDYKIYCLNATSGKSLWNYTTGNFVFSSPAVAGGCVYIGSFDYKVYCLNAMTGGLLWNYTTGNQVDSSPAVAGGRVYIGSYNKMIYCLPTNASLPCYTSVTESADPLEFGSTETITIFGVASLPGIQTVLIAFQGSNHTMSNLGGGTWRYNTWTPGSRGNYTYTIYIKDSLNHWNATTGSIQVVDTKPPTYVVVQEIADPLELGNTETIYIVGVTDPSGVPTVLIEFGGTNHTMGNLGGGTWWYETWIPDSRGNKLYTIYMEDTLNHWGKVTGAIQVIDTISPTFTEVTESANPLELSNSEIITILGVTDLSGIQMVLLAFGGSNHTMNNLSGVIWDYAWIPLYIGNYPYIIYIEDYAGNWNATNGTIQVIDTTAPIYTSVTESANPLEFGSTETITIFGVADFSGIQTVWIAFEESYRTMTNLGGGIWSYNAWRPGSTGNYSYTISIQDNNGHWNATNGTIQVVDTTPPSFTTVIENADPCELGSTETIMIAGILDFSGIQTVRIEFEGRNHTMSDLGGGVWHYDAWSPSSTGSYSYTIYIQDTMGNWNATSGVIQVNKTSTTPNLEPLVWVLALIIVGTVVFTIALYRRLNKKIQQLSQTKASPPKDLPKKLKSP